MAVAVIVQEGPKCCCDKFKIGESGPCVIHETCIPDKPPPPPVPRAFSSIPDALEFRQTENPDGSTVELSVIAKRKINRGTVFGPMVGVLVKTSRCLSVSKFSVGSKEDGWTDYWLDSDELSNWMKYVHMEKDSGKQNIMVYQRNKEIFFCAMKDIEPEEELIAWYAKRYEDALMESAAESGGPDASATVMIEGTPDMFVVASLPSTVQNASLGQPTETAVLSALSSTFKVKALHVFKNPKIVASDGDSQTSSSRVKKAKSSSSSRPPTKGPLVSGQGRYIHRCDICDAAFRLQSVLNIHRAIHGAVAVPESINGMYQCPGCLLVLTSAHDLLMHVDRHKKPFKMEPDTQVTCPTCSKVFVSETSMRLHFRQIHKESEKNPVECEVCHKKLKSMSAYVSHKKIHDTSSEFFRCSVCLTNFKSGVELQEHSLSHCVDGQYHCTLCGKPYETFTALSAHLKSVHADKKFTCEVCGYAFVDKNRLKRHMAIHSTTFDFKCDLCEQMFKHAEHLNRHKRRVHDPAKPIGQNRRVRIYDGVTRPRSSGDYLSFVYKCMQCKLGFHQKKLLVRHLEDRHPEVDKATVPELTLPQVQVEAYACRRCRRQFMTEEGLNSHVRKDHHVDEPFLDFGEETSEIVQMGGIDDRPYRRELMNLFVCTVCDQRFWSAGKLIKHQGKHPTGCINDVEMETHAQAEQIFEQMQISGTIISSVNIE